MRLVIDTDVLVAAMRSPQGASAALLKAARQEVVTLVMSVPLALQYEAVCRRPEHRLATGLTAEEIDVFLNSVIAMGDPVESHFLWRPQLRDPGDEMVLEAAVNGRADALVTFNSRDFADAPMRFGLDLLLPRDALRRIGR